MFTVKCGACEEKKDFFSAMAAGWEETDHDFFCPRHSTKQRATAVEPPRELFEVVADRLNPKQGERGFNQPEDGSQDRYIGRRAHTPWGSHMFWWLVHNNVAHFLIGVLPFKPFFKFHDWTSRKMHGL